MFKLNGRKQFQNQRITRVISSPYQKLICAYGPKFIFLLDYNLGEKGKIIPEDPAEVVICAKFLRLSKKYILKNIEKRTYVLENNLTEIRQKENPKTNENIPDLKSFKYTEKNTEYIEPSYQYSFLLALAGEIGSIKIIDLYYPSYINILKGHGSRIIALLNHPIYEHILFSCSADTTIRMWDIRTNRTLIIFGGLCGHEDLVLCFDISQDGRWLVSGGSDNCIKIWEIPLRAHMSKNKLKRIHFPRFSSQVLHKTYINHIKFYGKIILSKNVSNRVSIFIFEDMLSDKEEIATYSTPKISHSPESGTHNKYENNKTDKKETDANRKPHTKADLTEKTLLECKKYTFYEANSEMKNVSKKIEEKILNKLFNENLFLSDSSNRPIKKQEINCNYVYKNSLNSKTIVMNDYKFKNKLVHQFVVYNNKLIMVETTGGCHIIDLDTFKKKSVTISSQKITDIVIFENRMYLITNGNTIEYWTLFDL